MPGTSSVGGGACGPLVASLQCHHTVKQTWITCVPTFCMIPLCALLVTGGEVAGGSFLVISDAKSQCQQIAVK